MLLAVFAGIPLNAQETLRTLTVSSPYSGNSGAIRAALNIQTRAWAIAWNQPPSSVVARIITEAGAPGGTRVISQNGRSATQGLDLAYDPQSKKFLLAYESPQGLRLQWLQSNLQPAGPVVPATQSGSATNPVIVIGEKHALPILFWIDASQGRASSVIRSGVFDANRITSIRDVRSASSGTTLGKLSASEHPGNGNYHLLFTESSATSRLLRLILKPDGSPIAAPVVLQTSATASIEGGETVFATGGGLVAWGGAPSIRYRTLLPGGGLRGPAKTIPQSTNARSVRAEYEVRNNRILAVWADGNQVVAGVIHPVSGAVVPPPFQVASGMASGAVEVSANKFSGKSIVIWEEAAATGTNRLQGALISSTPEIFPVEGKIVQIKVYNPPVISHGYKYLFKYHVKSSRTYRAYVTPETEFEGRRPELGDTVWMLFEPFRNRFRGYIEEIEVVDSATESRKH